MPSAPRSSVTIAVLVALLGFPLAAALLIVDEGLNLISGLGLAALFIVGLGVFWQVRATARRRLRHLEAEMRGRKLKTERKAAEAAADQWESRDFVVPLSPGQSFPTEHAHDPSLAEVQKSVWHQHGQTILEQLRPLLQEGWYPEAEVGPDNIVLRHIRAYRPGWGDWFVFIFSLGIAVPFYLLFAKQRHSESKEFRVRLQRRLSPPPAT